MLFTVGRIRNTFRNRGPKIVSGGSENDKDIMIVEEKEESFQDLNKY